MAIAARPQAKLELDAVEDSVGAFEVRCAASAAGGHGSEAHGDAAGHGPVQPPNPVPPRGTLLLSQGIVLLPF